jgi:hypothetical protein
VIFLFTSLYLLATAWTSEGSVFESR